MTTLLEAHDALKFHPEEGDLKVYYNPQVPGIAFEQRVTSYSEAVLILTTLVRFSTFEFVNRIKPDYSDVAAILRFEDGEWCDVDESEYQDDMDALFDRLADL